MQRTGEEVKRAKINGVYSMVFRVYFTKTEIKISNLVPVRHFSHSSKERIGIPPLLYIKENPFLEIRALFMLKFP